MDYYKLILKELEESGIVTSQFVRESEIPSVYLTRLIEKRQIQRVARGIYISQDDLIDDWYVFQMQFKIPIYSHLSALFLHNLTDLIVHEKEVTVYSGYNVHGFKDPSIKVHYIHRRLFDLGVTNRVTQFGNPVKVYDMERTICDLIRNRDEIPSEVFSDGIRRYGRSPNKRIQTLTEYAKEMKILKKVQKIMEIIIE